VHTSGNLIQRMALTTCLRDKFGELEEQAVTAQTLNFFLTPPQSCVYLKDRESMSMFADPLMLNNDIYSQLARHGFRRSGEHVYRPACQGCQACVSVRIPVKQYSPHRRDRRCLKTNADLSYRIGESGTDEQFELYRRYISTRHPGGGMDNPSRNSFTGFLTCNWSNTLFLEIRAAEHLVAVAVTDRLDDGLSAVYTFFDPEETKRGLGNFAILQQIELCRILHLDWLYLGYWIEDSPKMAYKRRFTPLQGYIRDHWENLD
jgi:arginyl-tRNA--protein-N-Asp/Glu arginylyltransferase